ncbi:hypothetical protein B0H14DRAFT_2620881 [Mycena olivaceomarginata]|nr:hypothetical protein B0H14DRAFT_2620881 [Mycena olivaceomarginata]
MSGRQTRSKARAGVIPSSTNPVPGTAAGTPVDQGFDLAKNSIQDTDWLLQMEKFFEVSDGRAVPSAFTLSIEDDGVHVCFTMNKLGKGWIADLTAEDSPYDLLNTTDTKKAPIVQALHTAVAEVATTLRYTRARKMDAILAAYEAVFERHTERPVSMFAMRLRDERSQRSPELSCLVVHQGHSTVMTIPVKDWSDPLRPDFTPPPPPYEREGQHSMEANTLVRSVYKNAQLVKRIEQAVAFLLEDESGWWDNVFLRLYTLNETPFSLITNTGVVTVSTSRDVWGSKRLRGVEEILLPKVDPLTGNEIVKGANTIFAERGRIAQAAKWAALMADWGRVPRPSTTLAENSCHAIKKGSPCARRHERNPLEKCFYGVMSWEKKQPDYDVTLITRLKDVLHLRPLGTVSVVEIAVKISGLTEEAEADRAVAQAMKGLVKFCEAITVRIGYQPWRCYLYKAPENNLVDSKVPFEPQAGWSVRWVAEYRDYYSGQILYGAVWSTQYSGLEVRPLRPSLDRLRLIGRNGKSNHSPENTVLTCIGYNLLHNCHDPALPRLLSILRAGAVLVSKNDKLPKDCEQLWLELVDRVARIIDNLSANMSHILHRNVGRSRVPLTEVVEVYLNVEKIVDGLGLVFPRLEQEWLELKSDLKSTSPAVVSSTADEPVSAGLADPDPESPVLGANVSVSNKDFVFVIRPGTQAESTLKKVRESIEASQADPLLRSRWTEEQGSNGVQVGNGDDGDQSEQQAPEQRGFEGAAKEVVVLEGGVIFNSVDEEFIRGSVPAVAELVRRTVSNPSSRFHKVFKYCDKWAVEIQQRGDVLLPGMEWVAPGHLSQIVHCRQRVLVIDDGRQGSLDGGAPQVRVRNPLQSSEGHITHGLNMFHGFQPHDWHEQPRGENGDRGLRTLDFEALNVVTECWSTNLFRYNYTRPELEAWDHFVVGGALHDLSLLIQKNGAPHLREWWADVGEGEALKCLECYKITDNLPYLFPPAK